ncbi:hypothetical protein M011DRAFT_460754 [Sporormia fimetaria CBS 119925]|uniref:DUF7770 domain-containing protein n=1 Tax=Sporormia fimetaria CBS 119925 TaxID=1340428 RepID=A0A6A6V684_9PLEO|nr:hypothetical protein M011DRAFT_460754 [Sporormia fimetaria CBS 119925]
MFVPSGPVGGSLDRGTVMRWILQNSLLPPLGQSACCWNLQPPNPLDRSSQGKGQQQCSRVVARGNETNINAITQEAVRRAAQPKPQQPPAKPPAAGPSAYAQFAQPAATPATSAAASSSSLTTRNGEKDVLYIRVIAHSLGPKLKPNGITSTNHWTIWAIYNGGSVQFNMKASEEVKKDPNTGVEYYDTRGIFVVKDRSDYKTERSAECFDIPIPQGKTVKVKDIEGAIRRNHWDLYNMNNDGVGCRHWVLSVMRGLARLGLADGTEVENVLAVKIKFLYSTKGDPKPHTDPEQGTFHGTPPA